MSTSTSNPTLLDTNADFVSLYSEQKEQGEKTKSKEKKLNKKKNKSEVKIISEMNTATNQINNEKSKKKKRKEIQTEENESKEDSSFFVDCIPQVIKINEQQPESKKKKRKKNKGTVEESNEDGKTKTIVTKPSVHVSPLTANVPKDKTQDSIPVKEGGRKKRKKNVVSEDFVNDSIDEKTTEEVAKVDSKETTTGPDQNSVNPTAPITTESNDQAQADSKPVEQKKPRKPRKKDNSSKKEPIPSDTSKPVPSTTTASTPIPSTEDLQKFISSNKITYEPTGIFEGFPPILKFDQVKVTNPLQNAFLKFEKPSPIQSAVWPVLIAKRDVVGIAETGSGKTLAFGIPAFEHILSTPKIKTISVLVIAPTRELAMQTESTLSELGKLTSPAIKTLCVYGGVDKNAQRKALQAENGVRAVAGTPGRLLDLANEGHLKLDNVSWLVLDEADRMLDKGFENDIRAIIDLCLPSKSTTSSSTRLTAMFSATWPLSVRRLASDFMKDPVRILVGDDQLSASCSVEQSVEVLPDTRGKEFKLFETLRTLEKSGGFNLKKDKVIVFALYKKEAQRLHGFLLRKGFGACCIEGDMSQDKRSQSLEDFKSGRATILVATDVAARGLDIPKVEVVVNVTFPLTIEDYIHRIGRTGRAGRTGKSITFFTDEDKVHAGELMRVLKDANQVVPEDLKKFGGQIKKKTHAAYGDHWKDIDPTVKAKKIKFD